ncbi:exocyst complex component 7-like, partial [Plectropomus leopardus]|uniref:exocyst complex component 7-like n=1 Tax=Plectropomus leopardus TaxID=160734 RepID=UPI001C4D084D
EALDNLMLEGDNIVSAARRAIMRHDYSAVLTIFPILRHLKMNKSEFDSTLQGTAASTKNKLPTLITSMETIGAKALEEFADSIKARASRHFIQGHPACFYRRPGADGSDAGASYC